MQKQITEIPTVGLKEEGLGKEGVQPRKPRLNCPVCRKGYQTIEALAMLGK
jgi:hypothetical protein